MNIIYNNCCGIEFNKGKLLACFIYDNSVEIREYNTNIKSLLELSDWLIQVKCQIIAMDNHSLFGEKLYKILEASGLIVIIINVYTIKNMPGRIVKTKDCEWIAELLQYGLLQASESTIVVQQKLRDLVDYRKSLVANKKQELLKIWKMLVSENIKVPVMDGNGMIHNNKLENFIWDFYNQSNTTDLRRGENKKGIKIINDILSDHKIWLINESIVHLYEINIHIKKIENKIYLVMKNI
ncbi:MULTISPECIES: IS110 family transposase [Blautia]|uniref:IS110 family transposase n=1 Tax=Blautia TaxID=572511 RepID=UPI000BA3548A|nr:MULTISPECIES: transposase [Blautia]